MILVVSLLIVIKTADIFVDNLFEIGEVKGISQVILGVTASAVGTSLPEFGSAMKKLYSPSRGTVLGSNVFNIQIGIEVPSLIMAIPIEPLYVVFDAPVLIIITIPDSAIKT